MGLEKILEVFWMCNSKVWELSSTKESFMGGRSRSGRIMDISGAKETREGEIQG